MSAVPSTAERTFLTFLGVAELMFCFYLTMFAMSVMFLLPFVLLTGLATVALLCRAVDTAVWSPALWYGTLPTVLCLLMYVVALA